MSMSAVQKCEGSWTLHHHIRLCSLDYIFLFNIGISVGVMVCFSFLSVFLWWLINYYIPNVYGNNIMFTGSTGDIKSYNAWFFRMPVFPPLVVLGCDFCCKVRTYTLCKWWQPTKGTLSLSSHNIYKTLLLLFRRDCLLTCTAFVC
jgi:hypothetical protein